MTTTLSLRAFAFYLSFSPSIFIYLFSVNKKIKKDKTNLMRLGTQEMLGVLEVKGEATEASSSDREMPP